MVRPITAQESFSIAHESHLESNLQPVNTTCRRPASDSAREQSTIKKAQVETDNYHIPCKPTSFYAADSQTDLDEAVPTLIEQMAELEGEEKAVAISSNGLNSLIIMEDHITLKVLLAIGESMRIYHLQLDSERKVRVQQIHAQSGSCDKTLGIWKSQAKWMLILSCVSGGTGIVGGFGPMSNVIKPNMPKSIVETAGKVLTACSSFSEQGSRVVQTAKEGSRYDSQDKENSHRRDSEDASKSSSDDINTLKSLENALQEYLRSERDKAQRL